MLSAIPTSLNPVQSEDPKQPNSCANPVDDGIALDETPKAEEMPGMSTVGEGRAPFVDTYCVSSLVLDVEFGYLTVGYADVVSAIVVVNG
jgi:hypothetical protein